MHASIRDVLRYLEEHAPEVSPVDETGSAIEPGAMHQEAPRTVEAQPMEGTILRARRISGEPVAGFRGFLDGTQQSRVLGHFGGAPIVASTVAAAIRVRVQRRMKTWRRPIIQTGLYLPRRYLPGTLWEMLAARYRTTDTTRERNAGPSSAHPLALLDRALHDVQQDRERLEHGLAQEWCGMEDEPLFVDGGISGSERVAVSPAAVGVVKTHRTLYADEASLPVIFGLRRGERSTAFRITWSGRRASVASWYVRVRDRGGHDPLWGLLRIEVAAPLDTPGITERADEVSRWILAEVSPISLPDARWDRMMYGIRDCEEFLRAICGG